MDSRIKLILGLNDSKHCACFILKDSRISKETSAIAERCPLFSKEAARCLLWARIADCCGKPAVTTAKVAPLPRLAKPRF